MSHNSNFVFSVNSENNTINIRREYSAKRPLVWDAYTKEEILDLWWAPKPWKARTKTMNFSDGGKWIYAMIGPEGEEIWSIAQYSEIKPIQKFNVVDAFSDANGNVNKDLPQSKWELTFSDKGSHTLVEFKISYDELSQMEAVLEMGFKEGLSLAMDGLDELLPSLKIQEV